MATIKTVNTDKQAGQQQQKPLTLLHRINKVFLNIRFFGIGNHIYKRDDK